MYAVKPSYDCFTLILCQTAARFFHDNRHTDELDAVKMLIEWLAQEGVMTRQRGCWMCRAIVTSQQSEVCDEQNFRKWRCCFSCEHFELIFFREWSSNVVSLLIEDNITSYSNGRGKCILITTWKFCKKGFWSVLVSLQVRKIMWVRCGISLDKIWFFSG